MQSLHYTEPNPLQGLATVSLKRAGFWKGERLRSVGSAFSFAQVSRRILEIGVKLTYTQLPSTGTMPQSDISLLYLQVRRRLIESGEWDRIRAIMNAKLNETGWCDDVHHKSKETAKNLDPLTFKALYAKVAPQAETSIPLSVKREISTVIRQQIEKQFE